MKDRALDSLRRLISVRHAFVILAIGVGVYATWIALRYSRQPLLEATAFRQTHTAMTAYWMIREGWHLAYETPVAGYPWQIPIEFPLYQSLVALISWVGGFPLDQMGRLVSFLFLMACAWPAFKVVRKLDLPVETAWAFCALLWSSPLYLLWGRTFLMETSAVFFTFAAVPYALDLWDDPPRAGSAALFGFWCTLGMLQKATTTGPAMAVLGIVLLAQHVRTRGYRLPSGRKILYVLLAFGIPLVAAVLWARFTDSVKSLNILGRQITTGGIAGFMFGTGSQRLDLGVLRTIFWDRIMTNDGAGVFGLVLLAAALLRAPRRSKILIGVGLVGFVLPILMFTNLHIDHEYYQTGSLFWLTGALAIAALSAGSRLRARHAIGLGITLGLVGSNLYAFSKNSLGLVQMQIVPEQNTTLALASLIRHYTPTDSAIAVFGMDWSSQVPYYAQRKAFVVRRQLPEYDAIWANPGAYLGGLELSAEVFCLNSPLSPTLVRVLGRTDIQQEPDLYKVGSCYLWLPGVRGILLPGGHETQLPMAFLGEPSDAVSTRYGQPEPAVACDARVDAVNGISPAPAQVPSAGLMPVDGWVAVAGKSGITPDEVFVTLTGADGGVTYVKAVRVPRPDVGAYFGQPQLPDPGFTTVVDGRRLHGAYTLGLAWGYQGKLQPCAQFSIPVKFEAAP